MTIYDDKFLKTSIIILQDELHDVSVWSVYNDDKLNEEINKVKSALTELKEAHRKLQERKN